MDRTTRMRGNYEAAQINFDLFIERLFTCLLRDRPDLRHLFPQRQCCSSTPLAKRLKLIVENLDRLDQLEPVFIEMGKDHRHCQVPLDAVDAFKAALCQTFYETVGCNWNEEHERDWNETIDRVWGVMFTGQLSAG